MAGGFHGDYEDIDSGRDDESLVEMLLPGSEIWLPLDSPTRGEGNPLWRAQGSVVGGRLRAIRKTEVTSGVIFIFILSALAALQLGASSARSSLRNYMPQQSHIGNIVP